MIGCCFCFGSIPSFFLELFLHWSPVAYWALTDLGVPLSVSCHFAFSYCSWGSQGKNTKVLCHSLLQWTIFCQTTPPWPVHLGWPHTAWLSFIELDKAVVCVLRLTSLLWLWFQCVCPLMLSHNTYHLTWVSLDIQIWLERNLTQRIDSMVAIDWEGNWQHWGNPEISNSRHSLPILCLWGQQKEVASSKLKAEPIWSKLQPKWGLPNRSWEPSERIQRNQETSFLFSFVLLI